MRPNITLATLALTALALAGCAQNGPAGPTNRLPVYQTDLTGKAASCSYSPVTPQAGKTVTATITTGGGGWCGIPVRLDGAPYAAGLLTQQARNGRVYIHSVGDDTRIDYTPRTATVGPDSFTVQLLPGNAIVQVSVNTPAARK